MVDPVTADESQWASGSSRTPASSSLLSTGDDNRAPELDWADHFSLSDLLTQTSPAVPTQDGFGFNSMADLDSSDLWAESLFADVLAEPRNDAAGHAAGVATSSQHTDAALNMTELGASGGTGAIAPAQTAGGDNLNVQSAESSFFTPAHSFGRASVSAYVTETYPDGRPMNDGESGGETGPSGDGPGSSGLVISQVYADGGETGSEFQQDYLELFNRGTTSVSLAGWSLQYAATGSGSWTVAPLEGSIGPGQYYLVWGATGLGGTNTAPTADAVSTIDFAADGGKVALVNSLTALVGAAPTGTSIIDFVGYGTADAFEGSGAAPAGSLTDASLRDNGGLADTDNNDYDFTAAAATPRNSASPHANMPPVNSVPDAQWTAQDTAKVFSTANGNALSISDPDAGSASVEVWLSGTNGTLTLATTSGLTFNQGDGSADADMVFDGTISDINAALNGLSFLPDSGYRGPAVIGLVTDDLGNSGAGGPQYAIDTVLVSVGGPLVAVNDEFATWEDTATDFDLIGNDAFVHGNALVLSITSAPTHGIATIDDNGTSETYDDFLAYTPDANYSGSDSLTYQVTDGYGNTSTASAAIDVVSINDARIVPPPDQATQEGDAVSLQIATPDNSGPPLTFTATGLPAGLAMSPSGLITDHPLYSDAETSDGVYTVTVTATAGAGADSDTQSFVWYINDTNRIQLIDDYVARAGSLVSLMPIINGEAGASYTFSASALPPGVSIDPNFGFMTGMIPQQPESVKRFTTTITATGGGDSDSQTFDWIVLSGTAPVVLFAINDTYRTNDDITVLDPPLPLSVQVTLYDPPEPPPPNNPPNPLDPPPPPPGPTTVTLTVPSVRSTLTTPENQEPSATIELQMQDGETKTITMTPQQVSAAEDDVVLVAFVGGQNAGEAKATNMESVQIGTAGGAGRIRAENTPTGMADRVTVKKPTPFNLYFVGPEVLKAEVRIEVLNQSATKGDVGFRSLNPAEPQLYSKDETTPNGVYTWGLQGIRQTDPGNAGQLQFVVYVKGHPEMRLATSDGFSVAAIPIGAEMHTPKPLEGKDRSKPSDKDFTIDWGVWWVLEYVSDSGRPQDLDKVYVKEQVVRREANPAPTNVAKVFLQSGIKSGGWLSVKAPGGGTIHTDANSYGPPLPKEFKGKPVEEVVAQYTQAELFQKAVDKHGNGVGYVDQYFIFYDERTGMTAGDAKLVKQSGFAIRYSFEKVGDKYYVRVKKTSSGNHGADGGTIAQADTEERSVEVIKPKLD